MPSFTSISRAGGVVALTLCLAGCTITTAAPAGDVQVPFIGDTPTAAPQQDDQEVRVTIENGSFDSSVYAEQTGATHMLVITTGGPYLFEIDRLVDRRELPEDGFTLIQYDTTDPGDYTIRAYTSTTEGSNMVGTAVLRIADVGT